MSKKPKTKSSPQRGSAPAESITLAAVVSSLEQSALNPTRLRDLRSAVKRVAILIGQEPAAIRLDLEAISSRLADINPVAAGMSAKRFANLRSDFLAAVKASGVATVSGGAKTPMSVDWVALFRRLSGRRAHIGLSRFARYASGEGIAPQHVNDEVIERFIAAVRAGSLHSKPDTLHRQVTQIWNEATRDAALGLRPVSVPSFRGPPKRIDWQMLSDQFREEVERHLAWCRVSDPFASDARSRPLAARTLRLRRDQIHAAVTALVQSGVKPSAITSLADLVSPENFKRILRWRLDSVGGQENVFNYNLGKALIQVAIEWVKVDEKTFAEIKRLFGKMPVPAMGLTDKNKRFLRQFDDPKVLQRLYELPWKLWAEVKRETRPNFRTLAKAQTAIAIGILCYIPLRPQNLFSLAFDTHLFLKAGPGAISTLELPAAEVKNREPLSYDIPAAVTRMLFEYRDCIAPKIIGTRPTRLFVTVDGVPKVAATLSYLIRSWLYRRAGIVLTPHQFRHLSAKIVLDAEPGAFETVKQFLGHKSLKTTVGSYAGIDSRRAARRHHQLVQRALEVQVPTRRRKKRST
jgi:integrase